MAVQQALNKDLHVGKWDFLEKIWSGKITPEKLNKSMFFETANTLKEAAYRGFGKTINDLDFGTPDYDMLFELRTNIYMFSAAKNFQQTLEMSDFLVDSKGNIVSFKEFKEGAGIVFDRYNEDWLKAEYNTSIGQSRSAAKWNQVIKNKENFPYLRYSAVEDAHTSAICRPLDGIIRPINDSFWNHNMPLNHFNCRCVVIQMSLEDAQDDGITSDSNTDKKVNESEQDKNPLFNMNPGKDKEIFKSTGRYKHPYFEVSKKYRDLAKRNFDMPIPKTDENN